MSVVNHAEVVSHFVHAGMAPLEVDAMLRPLPVTIIPADAALATMAGRLRRVTAEADLSLGDPLALREGLPAWTADKQWRTIDGAVGASIVVIR